MEQEIWRDIEGYDGFYQVSNMGRVRSAKKGEWRLMSPSTDHAGYCRVVLSHNGKSRTRFVHRLVAFAFVDGYCEGLTVDHINGNQTDNRADNLRWMTFSDNIALRPYGGYGKKHYPQIVFDNDGEQWSCPKPVVTVRKKVMRRVPFARPADTEEEQWRDVEGYEGLYVVSNLGRVMSLIRGVILRPTSGSRRSGHLVVILSKNNRPKSWLLHRLVAKAFVDGYADGLVVNHKDENPSNNRADNLEWVTALYNRLYGTCTKRIQQSLIKSIGRPVSQYTLDGKFIRDFQTLSDACQSIGVSRRSNSHIRDCCNGKRTDYHGYRWKWKQKQ